MNLFLSNMLLLHSLFIDDPKYALQVCYFLVIHVDQISSVLESQFSSKKTEVIDDGIYKWSNILPNELNNRRIRSKVYNLL